jgi:hypothetical protein
MNWKKVLLVTLAAMAAAYAGVRLALPGGDNLALAGGAGSGVVLSRDGLVTIVTGSDGQDANRLVLVDTNRKRILAYRLRPNWMRLIVARPYKYDFKMPANENSPGNGYSYDDMRDMAIKTFPKEEERESLPRGQELVLTTDGPGQEGNRLVLVNPTEKRIAIYRFNGNSLGLIALRSYDFDEQLEATRGIAPGDGYDYLTIRKMVEEMLKSQPPPRGN